MKIKRQLLVCILTAVVCVACASVTAPAQGQYDKYTVEPILEYQLEVNGKVHTITDHVEINVEIEVAGPSSITLVPNDFRVFKYGGMHFKYPARYLFTTDHDEESLMWAMDSPSVGIMLFVYEEEIVSAEDLAESLEEQYLSADTSDVKVQLGGRELDGIAVKSDEMYESYVQTVFEFDTDEGSRILVLQDFYDENGEHSDEYNEMLKMLGEDLKVLESSSTDM